ncbi:S8 family serine peptidase [Arthrobacter globiformis]|uniref:S8 family serine peptidase n=1 Tax=Arthrobacter globiformis TaxID=1665 RepID=UPI001CB94435|nr:S8 family serine peptidase [Arthrobacter globiformis]
MSVAAGTADADVDAVEAWNVATGGNGTSMSSPIVAATAALSLSSHPGATNTSVRTIVEWTSDKIPGTGTFWAHGRVNACRAVRGSCT